MRILVVDDDPATLLVSAMALEHEGIEVIQAAGGVEAIVCARQMQPDAILLDLVMPDMDGLEVLERLQSLEATRDIAVIFRTAKSGLRDLEELTSRGARGVIAKPTDPSQLAAAIRRILGGSKSSKSS